MDAYRRYENSGSETEGFITHGTAGCISINTLTSGLLAFRSYSDNVDRIRYIYILKKLHFKRKNKFRNCEFFIIDK